MKVYLGKYPKNPEKERKISVRIDDWDTWSLDNTLALIIEPALIKLRENVQSAPYVEDEDVPDDIKSTAAKPKENDYDVDEFYFERWNYVLDQMIWSFSQLNIDWEAQYYSGKSDFYFESVPESEYKRLVRTDKSTLKVDYEGLQLHEEKIKNGIRLFGKYYMNLWT